MSKFNKSSRSFSDKKKPSYKSKSGFYKEKKDSSEEKGSENTYSKRPINKDKNNFGKKSFGSYNKKNEADKKSFSSGRKKPESEQEPEKLSYKAKRSFTKNKEFRKDKFPKRTPFEKNDSYKTFENEKTPFKRKDNYKKSELNYTPKSFKKDFNSVEPESKRIKYIDFEKGKSFSGPYKKEFSKEKKSFGSYKNKPSQNTSSNSDGLTRLNKYLANAGIASRREADTLIKSGVVKVNGVTITEMGFKIKAGDTVIYGDAPVKSERKVYLLLNKPKDYITTVDDPQERKTVMELIAGACRERVYPVGRLDRNTTGLLLFTNDGELTKKLTHPKHNIKKVYHVSLNKGLRPEDFKLIIEGIELEDGMITADDIAFVGEGKKEIGIEIHSGRNRIIRRIFEHLGYEVLKLDRVTFAGLTKKDLPRGKYRFLNPKEVSFLQMIG